MKASCTGVPCEMKGVTSLSILFLRLSLWLCATESGEGLLGALAVGPCGFLRLFFVDLMPFKMNGFRGVL